jgi:hypothetical protein
MREPLPAPVFNLTYGVKPTDIGAGLLQPAPEQAGVTADLKTG